MRMLKSRRMRWARHVARMGGDENAYTILVKKLKKKSHWKTLTLVRG
jgi:hypothetical protein